MSQTMDIKKLIARHYRRLQLRKEQKAKYGLNTPPEIVIEIEEIEEEIGKLELELEAAERKARPLPPKAASTPAGHSDGDSTGIAINRARNVLANILSVSLDQIYIRSKRSNVWQLELPPAAVERLIALHQSNTDPALRSLNLQRVKIVRHQPPQTGASLPQQRQRTSRQPNRARKHPLQISLAGNAVQGAKNELQLVVQNTAAENYGQVSIQLETPRNGLSLRPTELDFPLRANSTVSIPIILFASRAGLQKIELWACSVPTPKEGFLHQTMSLPVKPPPAKSIIEIELT